MNLDKALDLIGFQQLRITQLLKEKNQCIQSIQKFDNVIIILRNKITELENDKIVYQAVSKPERKQLLTDARIAELTLINAKLNKKNKLLQMQCSQLIAEKISHYDTPP